MKSLNRIFWSIVLSVMFCVVLSAQNSNNSVNRIAIDPSQHLQTLEGWGSSLCWWAGQVGKWDEQKMDDVINLITSPDKLNMNIFRYNIGGGDDPSHADGHMVKGKGKRAEMEGFKASLTAPYNWNADEAQRKVMLKIKAKRPDAIFEAFSNSAPYWMTYSGCSAGNDDPLKDNLRPEYYDMFCNYLVDVCKHYHDVYNINFRTLEPFNESYSNYWYNKGSQEGCHFEPATQIEIIRRLYPKLQASSLQTVISASDETSLNHFLTILHAYQSAGDIWTKIGQFNTHTYSGTDAERAEVRSLVKTSGKRFWQSETGPSAGKGYQSNLLLLQKMFDDLRIMQPIAWLDWQMVEEHNNTWCVISGYFKTQEYEPVKNFYVQMQITRFFKSGYTLIETNHKNVLAAVSPMNDEYVIALLNTNSENQDFNIDLSKLGSMKNIACWRTSETEDCSPIASPTLKNNELRYTCPPQSVTTFIFSNH